MVIFDLPLCLKFMNMNIFLSTSMCLMLLFSAGCSTGHRIYFVRHAEKSAAPARDPDLTDAGRQRAEQLSKMLRNRGIEAIYSTDTRRTRQTAGPLAQKTGLPILLYSNDTTQRFLYQLLDREQSSLVVGHSNTVIRMLRDLGLSPSMSEIPDNDYDNLFIVSQRYRNGRAGFRLHLKERIYGRKSPASGISPAPSTMMIMK
jgi:broad specificity phosphatase PhoE